MPDIDGFLVRSLVITSKPSFPSYHPAMPGIDGFLPQPLALIALIPGGRRLAQARVLPDRRRLCRQRLANVK